MNNSMQPNMNMQNIGMSGMNNSMQPNINMQNPGMGGMNQSMQQSPYIPNRPDPKNVVNPVQLVQGEKITFTGQDKIDLLNNQEPLVPVENKKDHTKSDAFADLEAQ